MTHMTRMTRMTRMARTVARMARWLADFVDPFECQQKNVKSKCTEKVENLTYPHFQSVDRY